MDERLSRLVVNVKCLGCNYEMTNLDTTNEAMNKFLIGSRSIRLICSKCHRHIEVSISNNNISKIIGLYPKPSTYLEYIYGIGARIGILTSELGDIENKMLEEEKSELEIFKETIGTVGKWLDELYKEIMEEKHFQAKKEK
jgi:hypothetical protein